MSGANEPGGPTDTNEWDSAMAAIRKSRPYLGDAYRAYTPPREGGPTKQEDKISLRQDPGYGKTPARSERYEEFVHRYQENLLDRFKLYSTFHCHSSAEQDFYLSLSHLRHLLYHLVVFFVLQGFFLLVIMFDLY